MQKINRLMQNGDFAGARKRLLPLLKKEPRNAGLQNVAGICHARGGSDKSALPYFAAAVKLAPGNVDFRCNLVLFLILSGNPDKAAPQLAELLDMAPKDGRPHYYRALIAKTEDDSKTVIAACTEAIALREGFFDALKLRALTRAEMLQPEAALEDFRTLVGLRSQDAKVYEAMAMHLSDMGHREEALAAFEEMRARDPHSAVALRNIAALCPETQLDGVRDEIERLAANKPRDPRTRVQLELAQATVSQRMGDGAGAMVHFDRMHALDSRQRDWNIKKGWDRHARLTAWFPMAEARAAKHAPAATPVFIVGLPRSGTTLVELILTAAPGVVACGELNAAAKGVARHLGEARHPTPDALESFAANYIRMMPELPEGAKTFTDKMPANYAYLGPLLTAFPHARVVHLRRDPRDVVLSMWQRRFPAGGMNYANRLDWIADQANLYRSYMRHWEAAYPDHILTLDYEALVRDLEDHTRRLAEHCRLDWCPAMLRPDQNIAQVRTASRWQVRGKVHDRSVGGWQLLGDRLKPFTDALDPVLWPELA